MGRDSSAKLWSVLAKNAATLTIQEYANDGTPLHLPAPRSLYVQQR